jgi:hypothetical protein
LFKEGHYVENLRNLRKTYEHRQQGKPRQKPHQTNLETQPEKGKNRDWRHNLYGKNLHPLPEKRFYHEKSEREDKGQLAGN